MEDSNWVRCRWVFCSNCGTQADASTAFCVNCGADLKAIPHPNLQVSMRERGSELEDAVAGFFRSKGYDVQTRTKMRDRRDVFHEIDVLASKREDFGTIQIAVECKNVRSPIDIREIRNFNDKLSALGVTKGIFVSTGGFTLDARSDAASVNMELWDEEALEEKISRQEMPEKDLIHDALPFDPVHARSIGPRHLKNCGIFSETKQLNYGPFYFADYHCFSQHSVRGNSVIIESKGTVVVDGLGGQVVDCRTTLGQEPTLAKMGAYVGCVGLEPQTISSADLPLFGMPLTVLPSRIDMTRAKEIAKVELVKNLALEYRYETTRTSGTQVLNPKKKDIEILNVLPVKIPHLTGTYRYRNYSYLRTCLASTGAIILDQTSKCLLCSRRSLAACENCGAVVCESHLKNCSKCSKCLCTACAMSKGLISRSYYCPEHKPK